MLKAIRSCFAKDDVNNGRQTEMDITKGFAVIFMVWVHVLMYFGDQHEGVLSGIVYNIWGGPFAAPVFMISMGAGVCYSRKQSPADLAGRGIRLLVGSIVLNLLRFNVFMYVGSRFGFAYSGLDYFEYLLNVDILSFAGLALIFLAICKKMNWSAATMLVVSIVCSIFGTMLRSRNTGMYIVDAFANFIWGANEQSCFPFLNWIAFPVVGVILGQQLKRLTDKERFYRTVSPVCLIAAAAYLGVAYATSTRLYSPQAEYYLMDIVDVFFCVLLYIGLLGQNYLLLRVMRRCRFSMLCRFSGHLNTIYCIHWVVLMGCYTVNGLMGRPKTYSFAQITLFAAVLLAVSDAVAYVYLKAIRVRPFRRKQPVQRLAHATGQRSIRYALLTLIMH